jgi:HEPN domain-containing protein
MQKEKTKYWIDLSTDDLDTAHILLKKRKYLQCGFYCHQSVEKIIKGYYWLVKNEEPPYTHNLLKLAGSSGLDQLMDDRQRDTIDELMPLNIEARYPDEKEELYKTLDASLTKDLYKRTSEIIEWIQGLLKK